MDKDAMVKLLLAQAKPLIEMPCLADPSCILMDRTRCGPGTLADTPHHAGQLWRRVHWARLLVDGAGWADA